MQILYEGSVLDISGRVLLNVGYKTSDIISGNTEVKAWSQFNQVRTNFPGQSGL